MKQAALGFRAHSGWTAMVALSLEDGEPLILARQRPKLVETFTYEFRQPYHTAEQIPLEQAREFISRCKADARSLAAKAIDEVQTKLRERHYKVVQGGLLLASSKPPPTLEKILASHALIHAADGELFRNALVYASQRRKLRVTAIRERELFKNAAEVLKINEETLLRRITALGKGMGPPWSQDEKFAALAAWVALASRAK